MTFVIPDVQRWLQRCANASPEQLHHFATVLRRDFIAPQLTAYRLADERVSKAPVRHVSRPSYDERNSFPAKTSAQVAQFKQDRAERRRAQHALQVLVRTEELARMRSQYLEAQASGRSPRASLGFEHAHASAFAAHLLSHAQQMPLPVMFEQTHRLQPLGLRFIQQNLTADKAAVAKEVLAAFPGLFGVMELAATAAQTQDVARDKLYRKVLAALALDSDERVLLDEAFGRR